MEHNSLPFNQMPLHTILSHLDSVGIKYTVEPPADCTVDLAVRLHENVDIQVGVYGCAVNVSSGSGDTLAVRTWDFQTLAQLKTLLKRLSKSIQ